MSPTLQISPFLKLSKDSNFSLHHGGKRAKIPLDALPGYNSMLVKCDRFLIRLTQTLDSGSISNLLHLGDSLTTLVSYLVRLNITAGYRAYVCKPSTWEAEVN